MPFESDVFINCPFDNEYAPLLEAALFCIVFCGLQPRLATERLEAGENRLDKIYDLAKGAKFSIHDLSRCQARVAGEFSRLNMPFELGLDLGIRRACDGLPSEKKFIIFEKAPYETKRVLSDLSGQDVACHHNNYEEVIAKLRDFFRVEAGVKVDGASRIIGAFVTCAAWILEKKLFEGHSKKEALNIPTSERLEEMKRWMALGRPEVFVPGQV